MDNEKTEVIWNDFLELVHGASDLEQLRLLGELFLSFEERADLAKRYVVVKELLKGELTQREIAKRFDVSIAKITRGSNALKTYDTQSLQKITTYLMGYSVTEH